MTTENALAGGEVLPAPSESTTNANSEPATEAQAKPEGQEAEGAAPENSGEPSTAKNEGAGKQEPKKPAADQDRNFARMREKLRAKESENAALAKEVERLRKPLPVRQDMTEDERAALASRQSVRDEMREQAEERAKSGATEAHETRRQIFEAKVEAIKDRSPDALAKFYAVPCSPMMADYLAETDKAGELAAHLGSNPHEARRIAELPSARQAIELAKLEGKLSSAPEVRRISQAPAPSETRLKGGSSPPAFDASKASVGDVQAMLRKAGAIQ